jgi:integrase
LATQGASAFRGGCCTNPSVTTWATLAGTATEGAHRVRRITFHELRHTFGTRVAASGVPLRTIQHWMGRAEAKTTQVYAHYQPSDAEAEVVDAAFA